MDPKMLAAGAAVVLVLVIVAVYVYTHAGGPGGAGGAADAGKNGGGGSPGGGSPGGLGQGIAEVVGAAKDLQAATGAILAKLQKDYPDGVSASFGDYDAKYLYTVEPPPRKGAEDQLAAAASAVGAYQSQVAAFLRGAQAWEGSDAGASAQILAAKPAEAALQAGIVAAMGGLQKAAGELSGLAEGWNGAYSSAALMRDKSCKYEVGGDPTQGCDPGAECSPDLCLTCLPGKDKCALILGEKCKHSSDCGPGAACFDGICLLRDGSPCSGGSGCGGGQTCVNKVCAGMSPAMASAIAGLQAGAGLLADNGAPGSSPWQALAGALHQKFGALYSKATGF